MGGGKEEEIAVGGVYTVSICIAYICCISIANIFVNVIRDDFEDDFDNQATLVRRQSCHGNHNTIGIHFCRFLRNALALHSHGHSFTYSLMIHKQRTSLSTLLPLPLCASVFC